MVQSVFSAEANGGQRQHAELAVALTPDVYAAIGQLAFKHAFLEYQLMQIIYVAAGVDRRLGRQIVRQPRLHERLQMVVDLLGEKNLTLREATTPFDNELKTLGDDRDKIVHGVWVNVNGSPQLVLTRGNWTPQKGRRAKRSIEPQGAPLGAKQISALVADFDKAIIKANQIMEEVLALLNTSPDKLRPEIG